MGDDGEGAAPGDLGQEIGHAFSKNFKNHR
jgi:hypothetical protein